jgi:hypothetical protein
MNIITNADVKKFLTLLKAGMKNGRKRELKNYTSATTPYDAAGAAKEYFVSLEFHFFIDGDILGSLFTEEDFDLTSKVDELLGGL